MKKQLKIGVVGLAGGWSSERLASSLEEKTGFKLLIDLEKTWIDLSQNKIYCEQTDLTCLDGLIIKKIGPNYSADMLNRLEMLRYLGKQGVLIFSRPSAIIKSFNRLNGTLNLIKKGIPMPETIITEDSKIAVQTVQRFGEAVFKPLFSTKARGMLLLKKDDPELLKKIERFKENNPCLYIQKLLELPGRDLGVSFLGGKYLATYARVKKNASWNTTINSGGEYQAFEPSKNIIKLAEKAQKVFKLDFTSVDVVETAEGPMVFEVSAFGGFRGLLESQSIDVADLYADYVIKKIKKEK